MKKYLSIFKISLQQEFAYKTNFVMWRVRNVFQILIAFFLWDTIFADPSRIVFGYDKARILTYVFALMIVRAFVLSARAVDVSSDVAEGNLSNHLLKPISYFKYWLTRDFSSKVLNLGFAVVEFGALFLILKPEFYFQTNIFVILSFALSIFIAAAIYFCILFLVSAVPFWAPELGWGAQFLVVIVLIEFLSGLLFPIDILPQYLQKVAMLLPFPYMIFFPIQVYLGKISGIAQVQGFMVSIFWMVSLYFLMRYVWSKGLKEYQAFGR
jgi:ABC-2 type transport system permease protein